MGKVISGKQIKAGRALLGCKQSDLAAAAKISVMSVKNVERGHGGTSRSTRD
jgi:transcriptional regulator with XRE-family HTH domain